MTVDNVKKIIASSEFPADLQQRFGLILPRLDKYSLRGLGVEASRKESAQIAQYLFSTWERFAQLLDGLKKGDLKTQQSFFDFLKETKNKLNEDDRLYALYLVLDVQVLMYTNKLKLDANQFQQILDYELEFFSNLPKDEVLFLLRTHVLYLAQKLDLLKEMEALVFDTNWDFNSTFSKQFSDCLLSNKEILGQSGKNVGAWVQEFINFSAVPLSQRNVLQVSDFLVKNSLATKLPAEQRSLLGEILKLFLWFLNPVVDEDEIYAYKFHVAEEKAAQLEAIIEKEYSPKVPQPSQGTAGNKSEKISDIVPAPRPVRQTVEAPQKMPVGMSLGRNSDGGVNLQNVLGQRQNSDKGGISMLDQNPVAPPQLKPSMPKPPVPPPPAPIVDRPKPMPAPPVPTVSIEQKLADLKRKKNR